MGPQQCWWEEPLIQPPPQNRVITNTKSAWPWLCLVREWKPSRLSTVPLDGHASVSQRSFPDLQFGSPKLLLPLVTSFAFTKKSLALSFLQAAVGSHELTPPPTQTAQGTSARTLKGIPSPRNLPALQFLGSASSGSRSPGLGLYFTKYIPVPSTQPSKAAQDTTEGGTNFSHTYSPTAVLRHPC